MNTRFSRGLIYSIQVTVLVMMTGAALANGSSLQKVVDGVAIYLGVLPSEMVRGHPKAHPEGAMHGGVPASEPYHHIIVALFDNQSGERITDVEVKARVEELGHLSPSEKPLEPMTIADTVTYGNYFKLPGKGPYQITVEIRRPGSSHVTEARFEYRHP